MLTKFDFVNNDGDRQQFNTVTIPLNRCEFELEVRSSRRTKAQANGTWPGFTKIGACLVHMEGQIFGTDSADFNARKLALLDLILPDPILFNDEYPLGRLEVQLDGMTEYAKADVSIDGDITIPMEGLSPARAPLQITWVNFQGYFTGAASGRRYWLK